MFNGKKFAFTLSEVLITLFVIGVVAVLTIPSAYGNYRHQIRTAKVKNFYRIMNDALDSATDENFGNSIFKYDPNERKMAKLNQNLENSIKQLKPYLPVTKDCGFGKGNGCTYDGTYSYYNGYTPGPDEEPNFLINEYTYALNLADGSHMYFSDSIIRNYEREQDTDNTNDAFHYTVLYDMNGDQGPNRVGYDVFAFELFTVKNKLYPSGAYKPKHYLIPDDCNSSETGWGYNCTSKVLFGKNY